MILSRRTEKFRTNILSQSLFRLHLKHDELIKNPIYHLTVIPAKAGIQFIQLVTKALDSGFHRSDDFFRNRANCEPQPSFYISRWPIPAQVLSPTILQLVQAPFQS